jgi:Co/Zn/Cd efflux system component
MDFLLWYEEGPVGLFIRESLWGYPIVLSSHAVGMATVMGVVVALNMRVLGFAKGLSIPAFDRLLVVAWIGFIINLVSGLILFAGTSTTYFFQGTFQLKIGSILLGGVLMKLVLNAVRDNKSPAVQKLLAFLCLVSWTTGMVTGRLMAYLV